METDVVCPDCGKVIAPAGAVENSLRCRCAEERQPKVSIAEVPTRPKISVPIPDIAPAPDPQPSRTQPVDTEQNEKTCYVCGKSLAGRVRLKDHLGRYWCKDCASADAKQKRREEKHRCADCSRVFAPHKLQYFQTDRVCASCFRVREQALEKKILKSEVNKTRKKLELSRLAWMAIVALSLILIATVVQLMR